MDGWFLLSIGISIAVSVAFLIAITDDLKSQMTELSRRMDMLLRGLEECQLAYVTRNAQGKIISIVIKGDNMPGGDSNSNGQ